MSIKQLGFLVSALLLGAAGCEDGVPDAKKPAAAPASAGTSDSTPPAKPPTGPGKKKAADAPLAIPE
jgi:hypothetical protein